MIRETDINLKELVYLITDDEQSPRMVISIEFTADGGILYKLVRSSFESVHYRCEISKEKDKLKSLGIHE
jgi:hypothetical protein